MVMLIPGTFWGGFYDYPDDGGISETNYIQGVENYRPHSKPGLPGGDR